MNNFEKIYSVAIITALKGEYTAEKISKYLDPPDSKSIDAIKEIQPLFTTISIFDDEFSKRLSLIKDKYNLL